jgi:predicted adenylyl cyclase CyaB
VPRNVEIKARVADPALLRTRVAALATQGPIAIAQDDTFFPCASGRLKLRILGATEGELIHYHRADAREPKASTYSRVPTSAPMALRDALAAALGTLGRVRKARTLYVHERTRIHLDVVEGLGDFMELEVVLREDESVAAGIATAHALMHRLDIGEDALVARAYLDLLADRA